MKIKDLLMDVVLAFGVIGMVIGMLIPFMGIGYVIWHTIK